MTSRADDEPISLADAAAQLGVHYMTAYRYVRTGRLEARQRSGKWLVEPSSLAALVADGATGGDRDGRTVGSGNTGATGRRRRKGAALAARRDDLVRSLAKGDESATWRQVEDFLASGMDAEDVYTEVFGPAIRDIGDAWNAVG